MTFEEDIIKKHNDWVRQQNRPISVSEGQKKLIELARQKVKEVIDEDWLLFADRKRLEDEFLNWANKHNAKVCPMNVIAWFHPKVQNKFKKQLGLM